MPLKPLTATFGFEHRSNRCSSQDYHSVVAANSNRRGTVMLFTIIVTALISLMVLGILDSLSLHAAKASAIESNEKCFYLADAGVQHALAILKDDKNWTGTVRWDDSRAVMPADVAGKSYTVTVQQDSTGGVIISSHGAFQDAIKTRVITLKSEGTTP